jgi:hypothetical protein
MQFRSLGKIVAAFRRPLETRMPYADIEFKKRP